MKRHEPTNTAETERLRIAVIEPVGGHGGMDYYDFGLCQGLANAGAKAVLYTSDKTPSPGDAGFEVDRVYRKVFGPGNLAARGIRYLRGTLTAIRRARREGAHIVHFHLFNTGLFEYYNVFMAKFAGFPVAITAHDVESFLSSGNRRNRARFLYRRADIVIAHNDVSRWELAELVGRGDKIAVIPHGNYLFDYDPSLTMAVSRARLGLPADEPVVLFFGQIKQVKGLDILLDAWPRVVAAVPSARLVIAGRPWKMDADEIVGQIAATGVAESIVARLEFIPAKDASAYFSAADAIVLPYRKIYQSGVLLMAMSLKTPVVASDIAGMAEVIDHRKNGMLFQTGNAEDLALKIVEMIRDETLRRNLAETAFRDMQDKFDWDDIGKRTAQAMKAVARPA